MAYNGIDSQDPWNLSRILGFSSAKFIAVTYGREPLHVPRMNQGAYYAGLVTVDGLDEILSFASTRSPYVRVVKDGEAIDHDEYTYSGMVARVAVDGLLDRDRLMAQFARGATIILDSIQHWLPGFKGLLHCLQEELGADGRATAFISPPGEQALDPHADSYEVFVLQLSGTKRWSVYPRLDPPPPDGVILEAEDLGEPYLRLDLQPGDLLYLPWGTPHIVNSMDTSSVHVSIAVRPRTWGAVLRELIEPILQDGRLDGPAMMGRGRETELAGELAGWLEYLARAVGSIDTKYHSELMVAQATEDRSGGRAARLIDVIEPQPGSRSRQ